MPHGFYPRSPAPEVIIWNPAPDIISPGVSKGIVPGPVTGPGLKLSGIGKDVMA